ncbi:ComEA family DNA-binding protein [Bifidobacterium callitrichidarum]|uniref:ComEA family DNA-binding protein n=1 Tax=Bifidobacterium callitrichidarum TaxID=2052941 RepID=UPI003BAC0588
MRELSAVSISRTATKPLSELIGVRPSDAADETSRRKRDRPRLVFTVNQALVVILLLIAALGVSLTMLVQQSMSLAALSAGGTTRIAGNEAERDDTSSSVTGNESENGQNQLQTDSSTDSDVAEDDANGTPAYPNTSDKSESEQNANATTTPEPDDGRIDLNTATSEQLQTINGIGPVTAERILEHRKAIGRFVSVDQLLDVKGIGSKTLEKIRDQVKVG